MVSEAQKRSHKKYLNKHDVILIQVRKEWKRMLEEAAAQENITVPEFIRQATYARLESDGVDLSVLDK